MTILILGMLGLVLVHMVPWSPSLRAGLVSRLGDNGYRGLFAMLSLGALALVVIGKSGAPFSVVWEPPRELQHLTRLLVLVGFILLPAAHMPGNIKRFTRHPMLWGVVCWGVGHLLANGDLASIILFGGFTAYSLAAMASANARGAVKATARVPFNRDIMVVVAGLVAYAALTWFHGALFGYPLLG